MPRDSDLSVKWVVHMLSHLVDFAVRCNLEGFMKTVLSDPAFGFFSNIHQITRTFRNVFDYRRPNILTQLVAACHQHHQDVQVYGDARSALVFVYQQS